MPKENRISKLFNLFTKVDEDTDIGLLQNGSVASLTDMVLDNPFGKANIRGAFRSQNEFQTDGAVDRMINVKDENDNEFLIAANTTKLQRSVGGAWTDIKTGLTSGLGFQYTPITGGIVFTNGIDKPFLLSGDDFDTNDNVEIEAPDVEDVTIQRTSDSTGNLDPSSNYRWILVYKTARGEKSNVSHSMTWYVSHSNMQACTDADHKAFSFDELPVSTDSRVVRKTMYRTEGYASSGDNKLDGKIYYRIGDMDNDVTQWVDNTADEDLDFTDTITFTRVPESAGYTTKSNNRLWFSNITVANITQHKPPYLGKYTGGTTPTYNSITFEDSGTVLGNLFKFADTVSGGAGLLAEAYYQYMYIYVDRDGLESLPSYGVIFLTAGAGANRIVSTFGYDRGIVGANRYGHSSSVVKSRKIYRTLGKVSSFNSGDHPFYLQVEQDIDTGDIGSKLSSTYVDSENDHTNNIYVPPTPKEHNGAMSWSQVDRPAYFPIENVKQIFEDDADSITGFLDDGNGILIWKENSIIKLYHTGAPENWYIRKVWHEFGCDTPISLIKLGDTYYFQSNKKIYSMLSDQAPVEISYGKNTTFKDMTIIGVTGNDKWLVYTCTQSTSHFQLIYDRVVKAWYQFNFGTNDLTTSMYKKYENDFWETNILYAVVGRKMYDYDITSTIDQISGGNVAIDPSITFSIFKIDETTPAKLRGIFLDWIRVDTGNFKMTLTTQNGTTIVNLTSPGDTGITKLLSPLGNLPSSNFFKLKLSGIIGRINSIRLDLRPTRKGVGL